MISDHGLMGGAPEGTSKMLTMKHIHLRVEHGAQLNTLKVVSNPLIRGAACRLRTIVTTRPENAVRWFPTEIRYPRTPLPPLTISTILVSTIISTISTKTS